MDPIACMPLKTVTDGPLFGKPAGTLSELVNMGLWDGYAEARGGFEELKPNSGTGADAISAGGYSSIHQVATNYGWIRTYDSAAGAGSQYSKNLQFHPGGFAVYPTAAVGDCIYYGSDFDFNRIGLVTVGGIGLWAPTLVAEYWNGSLTQAPNGAHANWVALTTSETFTYGGVAGMEFESWTMPTDWALCTVGDSGTGNVLKKWMRIRVSATAGAPTVPYGQAAFGFWSGMRELYSASQSPRTSATSGLLKRHGQTATTEQWFSVNSSLFSGSGSPSRMASYRGRLFLVNGKDQKRWDGSQFVDIGLAASAATGTTVAAATVTGKGAGIWRYYFAWGYGPCQTTAAYSAQQDVQPLYGYGQANFIGTATTTAGVNELVNIQLTSAPPADASCVAIFCTQDLTNVAAGDRPNFPAFLLQSFRRIANGVWDFDNGFGPTAAVAYQDIYPKNIFPPKEALNYDVSPPSRCKFIAVYQNRLFLADNDTIYWSDAFTPDLFSLKSTTGFIRLARALGGRNMGIVEFADQLVAFTEDQTWGVTNVDLDVPQLYPIHPGVGCIAPDSIAVADGWLVWMAKDGFYAWDGGRQGPKKVSEDYDQSFWNLSYENHGGSKATIHNRQYVVRLSNPDYSTVGASYRLILDGMKWSTMSPTGFASTLFPLATIHAPLGNNDAGVLHPIWGKVDYGTGAGEYGLFLGELTTQDDGTSYTCSATMHFPLKPNRLLRPDRIYGYYQAIAGWGTPGFSLIVSSQIGGSFGSLSASVTDTGADYSIVGAKFSDRPNLSDLQIKFTVSSAAGGTVNTQRFFGAILEGDDVSVPRFLV